MERLTEKFRRKLNYISVEFVRSIINEIDWNARLIGIKGARGVGKTTLMLQYIKLHYEDDPSVLYISLDDLWFSGNSLSDLADRFSKEGGRILFIDEVHKYPEWSRALKNIYDDYPELRIVFTGSSLLEIINASADLSRRAVIYRMQGLSFREYLGFEGVVSPDRLTLEDILVHHQKISGEIAATIRPLKHFNKYLREGYYPFYKEIPALYYSRLGEVINMIIEMELPHLRGVETAHTSKLKQMLMIISESAPFVPNISKLSERTGINRNTLISYLHYLQEAGLLRNIFRDVRGITRMQKPDKIFLENTNLAYALGKVTPDMGSLRETFFANQLSYRYLLTIPEAGDFIVNENLLFEIGGRGKSPKQLDASHKYKKYIAADDIEYGRANTIPLWLFGFLY